MLEIVKSIIRTPKDVLIYGDAAGLDLGNTLIKTNKDHHLPRNAFSSSEHRTSRLAPKNHKYVSFVLHSPLPRHAALTHASSPAQGDAQPAVEGCAQQEDWQEARAYHLGHQGGERARPQHSMEPGHPCTGAAASCCVVVCSLRVLKRSLPQINIMEIRLALENDGEPPFPFRLSTKHTELVYPESTRRRYRKVPGRRRLESYLLPASDDDDDDD